jgi:GNAT superfamily N-acetyltransferase
MIDVTVERLTEYSPEAAEQIGILAPYLSERFNADPVDEIELRTIIDSTDYEQLVARLEGRIVGAATLSLIRGAISGKIGYLADFVTHADVRGQGAGDIIWEEMIRWCEEQGVDMSFTSSPTREEAHTFYFAHGAEARDTTAFHVHVPNKQIID